MKNLCLNVLGFLGCYSNSKGTIEAKRDMKDIHRNEAPPKGILKKLGIFTFHGIYNQFRTRYCFAILYFEISHMPDFLRILNKLHPHIHASKAFYCMKQLLSRICICKISGQRIYFLIKRAAQNATHLKKVL
jgi:hypothetical protein